MYEVTNNDLLMVGLVIMAGVGLAAILFHRAQQLMAFRERCIKVASKAREEGFHLFADLCEAAGIGSLARIKRSIDKLEDMFNEPGALSAHLDKLFTMQLNKRLGDKAKRAEILEAVSGYQRSQADAEAVVLEKSRLLQLAAKAGDVAGKAAPVLAAVNPVAGAAAGVAGAAVEKLTG